MPPRTAQAMKSPRTTVVKPESVTPGKKKTPSKSTLTVTTPKSTSTSAKTPKSEKKPAASSSSDAVAASASSSKTSIRKSLRKTKVEKEEIKGILKKESIRKTAKINGCIRIAGDVYDKARAIFDDQLGVLLKRASVITLHNKKKQITYQTINRCAKDLWNITVYSGSNPDEVKGMLAKEDEDYPSSDISSDE